MHVYIPIACVYTYIVVIENWGQSVSTSKCLSFQNLYFNNPWLCFTTTRVEWSILLIFFPLQAVFTFSEWYYKLLMEWEGWISHGVSLFFFKKTVLGSFYYSFFFIQHWIFKAGAFTLIWHNYKPFQFRKLLLQMALLYTYQQMSLEHHLVNTLTEGCLGKSKQLW